MAGFLQALDAALDQPRVEQGFFGKPDVEMHTELTEIVAAIFQLFAENVTVHVLPFFAEQALGVSDQRVEMRFALGFGRIVGALGFR